MVAINLLDFMQSKEYSSYWRFRITSMVVYFLDDEKKIIADRRLPDSDKRRFGMYVDFPSTYYDINWKNELQMFTISNPHYCVSVRKFLSNTTEVCNASDRQTTSPNGTFLFQLGHSEDLHMENFHGLEIRINGTYNDFIDF